MKKQILSLLHCGEASASGVTEKRKVHHINIIVLITIVSFLAYSSIYILFANDNVVLLNSAIAIFIFLPISLTTLILNHYGKLRLARWMISLNFTGVILALMLFGQANYFNAHFFFLAFCSTLFTYFPLSQWRDIAFFFVINLTLFIISHLGYFQPYPEVHKISELFTSLFSMLNIIVSTLILGGMIFMSEYATSHSDNELEALSTTDSLTGLLNRHGFMKCYEEEKLRCQRLGNFSALLFFDLDNFKPLNDRYGHDTGDLILKEVARRIKSSLRNTDVIGRFGGDEFIAIMCQVGDSEINARTQTETSVQKIREFLSEDYVFSSKYKCSASIGIAIFQGQSNLEEILKSADQAMYLDKKN